MKIKNIAELKQKIETEKLLDKYKLDKIGIFGSFARGENSNDIDFYIESDDFLLTEYVNLKKDLEEIIDKPADIMLNKYANPIILYRAKKDMMYVTKLKRMI